MRRAFTTRRVLLRVVLGGLILGAAVQWVWGGGRERAVRLSLQDLMTAVEVREGEMPGHRDQRLQQALDEHFTKIVTVRHADLPRTGAGRRALLLWGRLLGNFHTADLSMEHLDIALRDATHARATLDVILSARSSASELHERRGVELGLVRENGEWRIESVDVAAASNAEPEPRP